MQNPKIIIMLMGTFAVTAIDIQVDTLVPAYSKSLSCAKLKKKKLYKFGLREDAYAYLYVNVR